MKQPVKMTQHSLRQKKIGTKKTSFWYTMEHAVGLLYDARIYQTKVLKTDG